MSVLPALPTRLPAAKLAPSAAWSWRLREGLSAYLPVLLMAVLALLTWWLVKNTPERDSERLRAAPRHEADYTMQTFMLQRFGVGGRLRLQIEGDMLRHYPDTDTFEIDGIRLRSYGTDGAVMRAVARHAVSNGDATEIKLLGGAKVTRENPEMDPVLIEGEFLHAFLATERLRSHFPVALHQGGNELRAAGIFYDHTQQRAELHGPVRARLEPRDPALSRGAK